MWILPQNFEAYHLPASQILIILHNNWLWWMSPICPSCRSSSGMSLCWYLQPACKTINSSTSSVHVILSTILSAAPINVPGLNIALPPKPLALIAIIQLITTVFDLWTIRSGRTFTSITISSVDQIRQLWRNTHIPLHGPFNFTSVNGRRTRDRVALEDWKASYKFRYLFSNEVPSSFELPTLYYSSTF